MVYVSGKENAGYNITVLQVLYLVHRDGYKQLKVMFSGTIQWQIQDFGVGEFFLNFKLHTYATGFLFSIDIHSSS